MEDKKFNKEELFRKIKRYSAYKYKGMVPGLVLTIFGSVFFFVSVIVNMFVELQSLWVLIPCAIMLLGISLVTIALLISEKIRSGILKYNVKTFLEIITRDESREDVISRDSLYYDLIEVLQQKLHLIYYGKEEISQNIEDACNCLRRIMREKAIAGLANRMVYDNRNAFREICKIILEKCDKWNIATDSKAVFDLYEKEKDIKDSSYKVERRNKRRENALKYFGILKGVLLTGCLVAFGGQICTYKGDWVSLIFNFVAIVSLAFDLAERKLREKLS